MKLYLDDVRPTPEGWTGCRWPVEVISFLASSEVEEISLDHDLADAEAAAREGRKERTGMDVLTWIQREVVLAGYVPPRMVVHSSNPAAIRDMNNVINRIIEMVQERE